MGRIIFCLLPLVVFLASTTAVAADGRPQVSVRLELPHASLLPGVPFDAVVRYANLSNRPVAVGATATVIITPAKGGPVRMAQRATVEHLDLLQSRNFEIQPGDVQTGTLSWHSNWFYNDAAFTVPGTYELALELNGDPQEPDEGVEYIGNVRTSAVRLTRIEPTGEDAEVWYALKEASAGTWPSHGFGSRTKGANIADEIIAKYPASGYYPYALLLRRSIPMLTLDLARDVVARFTESPAYPHLLVAAAWAADAESHKAERQRSSRDVESYLRLALTYDDDALRTGNLAVKGQVDIHQRVMIHKIERIRRTPAQK